MDNVRNLTTNLAISNNNTVLTITSSINIIDVYDENLLVGTNADVSKRKGGQSLGSTLKPKNQSTINVKCAISKASLECIEAGQISQQAKLKTYKRNFKNINR
jgi:hypothetical protein